MHIVIFITVGKKKEGMRIARAIVEERLAACVNIIEDVCSVFRWKGKVEKAEECLLIAKSVDGLLDNLIKRVKELHSYTTPEIISFKIDGGSKEYLKWIASNVKKDSIKEER
jgi:periplasmic divalent cation tolerance protein